MCIEPPPAVEANSLNLVELTAVTQHSQVLDQHPPIPLPVTGTLATISLKRKLAEENFGSALYLFAGPNRRSSIGSVLQELGWTITEIDILQGGKGHDLTHQVIQEKLLKRIRAGEFTLLLVSPPCDTFTRVKFANEWGPKPGRSFDYPRGFPWLVGASGRNVKLANTLVDFSFTAMLEHLQVPSSMLILEFPEDLGAITSGKWKGTRPSSIFQWPQFLKVLDFPGVVSGGIHQSSFGTDYLKPTRLILKLHGQTLEHFYPGIPSFDDLGFYTGPIPKGKATVTLAKTSRDEKFRTTGTAAWPWKLCQALGTLAHAALGNCRLLREIPSDVSAMHDGDSLDSAGISPPDNVPYPITSPPDNYWVGGSGPPRETTAFGKTSPFFDGCGLTSPARWERKNRRFPDGKRWDDLRIDLERVVTKDLDETGVLKHLAALACGKDIFNWDWVESTRKIIHNWLHRQTGDYDATVPPTATVGQPFFLSLLHGLLREMRDADFSLFEELKEGVTLGVLDPLPHTPALYELQTAWRLHDDPLITAALENPNYKSVEEFAEQVELQFREEQALGWMDELSDEAFLTKYGTNSAISALAVLQEKDKLRVLHDGSNATRVNYRIRCRDRQRMPTVKEKHTLLAEQRRARQYAFALLADASKAHRRIKVCPREWGFLGCRLKAGKVWINQVQTFGISSASYWWGRAAGGVIRCMFGLLGGQRHLDLLLFADDVEFIAVERGERLSILLGVVILLALGMPFKWAKFRGGFELDWIGFHVSYKLYSIGLSQARATWVAEWTGKLIRDGWVLVSEMCSGLGRLNYAAQALYYERAFLGMLYMWTSTVSRTGKTKVDLPWAIRLILKWIGQRVLQPVQGLEGRLQEAPDFSGQRVEWFRSDAKAEDGRAWVGGWEIAGGKSVAEAKWFSFEVLRAEWPWVYAKEGDPQRVIAALELLGTLLCIILFDPLYAMSGKASCVLTGATDNKGNSYIVRKLASTKWPITSLLLELSEQLRRRRAILDLQWLPRDANAEADALTNLNFEGFTPGNRIEVKAAEIKWAILPEIMGVSMDLYKDVCDQRLASKNAAAGKTARKQAYKTAANKRMKWTDPW